MQDARGLPKGGTYPGLGHQGKLLRDIGNGQTVEELAKHTDLESNSARTGEAALE